MLGTGVWCFTVAESAKTDTVEVVGSQGRITFSTFGNEVIILENTAGKQEFKVPYPTHVQQPFIQEMVAELVGLGQAPSTGESAARTALVMDKIVGRA